LSEIIVVFVVGLTGIASIEFIASSWSERTPILQVPAGLIALPVPLGMALIALNAIDNLCRFDRRTALGVAVTFLLTLAVASASRDLWLPYLAGDAAIGMSLALFFNAMDRRTFLQVGAADTAPQGLAQALSALTPALSLGLDRGQLRPKVRSNLAPRCLECCYSRSPASSHVGKLRARRA
jgi:hypothetical protein